MSSRGRRLGLLLAGGSLLAVDLVLWRDALRLGFHFQPFGGDLHAHVDQAKHWLRTGEWFRPYQLEGPYELLTEPLPILYPPPAIPFFLAWDVIPTPLYWLVPIAVTAWIVWSYRPSWQAWTLIAGCLLWPVTTNVLWLGNPTMIIVCLVALAFRWPAAGPWVLLKPTFLPFALVGIRRRAWWLGLAALFVWCLPWLPWLPDYLTASTNLESANGLLYSWRHWPLAVVPIAAWLGRSRQANEDLGDRVEAVPRLPVALGLGQVDVGVPALLAHRSERLHLRSDRRVLAWRQAGVRGDRRRAVVEQRELRRREIGHERVDEPAAVGEPIAAGRRADR